MVKRQYKTIARQLIQDLRLMNPDERLPHIRQWYKDIEATRGSDFAKRCWDLYEMFELGREVDSPPRTPSSISVHAEGAAVVNLAGNDQVGVTTHSSPNAQAQGEAAAKKIRPVLPWWAIVIFVGCACGVLGYAFVAVENTAIRVGLGVAFVVILLLLTRNPAYAYRRAAITLATCQGLLRLVGQFEIDLWEIGRAKFEAVSDWPAVIAVIAFLIADQMVNRRS